MALRPQQSGGQGSGGNQGTGGSAVTSTQQAGSKLVTLSQDTLDQLMALVAQSSYQNTAGRSNNPPPRWATDDRYKPSKVAGIGVAAPTGVQNVGGRMYNTYMYEGAGLVDGAGRVLTREEVDENGQRVETPYIYDPATDGFNAYITADPEERELVADTLREAGYRIETVEDYIDGYTLLFDFSNRNGTSFDRTFKEFKLFAPKVEPKGKAAPTYRVTSPNDIKAVAKQVAYKTLGRAFSDSEADQFVKTYQQMEVASQQQAMQPGVATAAPDIGVAAEEFAMQEAPSEAQAFEFFGHMDAFVSSLRGL
jgi:hypothetical protein